MTQESVTESIPNKTHTGEQTKISEKIRGISDRLNGEGEEYVKSISNYIRGFSIKDTSIFTSERNVEEIIDSGYWSGCHEAGIIFASLLRAKGIDTKYIQALNREGVENYIEGKSSLNGHVYLEAEINGKKFIVNSTSGKITDHIPESMVIGAKGMDSWDIGLKKHEDMRNIFRVRHSELTQQ